MDVEVLSVSLVESRAFFFFVLVLVVLGLPPLEVLVDDFGADFFTVVALRGGGDAVLPLVLAGTGARAARLNTGECSG